MPLLKSSMIACQVAVPSGGVAPLAGRDTEAPSASGP
jgi:hypothetical protein